MRVYLDNAATTPIMPQAYNAMEAFVRDYFYNPSASYTFSKEVRKKIEEARTLIAGLIGALPEEIFFTSGGTEGDNWALREGLQRGHVITDAIEHKAVLNTLKTRPSCNYSIVMPDEEGIVAVNDIKKHMRRNTSMISVMYANNEIGTIEPVQEIGNFAREYDVLFHCDGVQAMCHVPIDVSKLNIDIFCASAHKFNGPKGSGFIYIRKNTGIKPMITGGSQEKNMRAGTENVPGIIGMAVAAAISCENLQKKQENSRKITDYIINRLTGEIDGCIINGPKVGPKRLPNNISIAFKDVDAQSLLILLDLKGIMAAAGSACSSSEKNSSHVLKAIGTHRDYINGTIRFSTDYKMNVKTADYVIEAVKESVETLRRKK